MTYCYYFFLKSSRGEEQEFAKGGPELAEHSGERRHSLAHIPKVWGQERAALVTVGSEMPRSRLHISRNRAIGSQQPLTLTHHCFGVRC